MHGDLQVSDLGAPSEVHGVHGAAGLTRWRSLAAGRALRGPYEAVEWACVPPGGISGEHRHTRTEEMYILLTGEGEALLNGAPHPVRAGELILTGLGATHALSNTGSVDLSWLTLEVPAQHTTSTAHAALAGREGEENMPVPPPGTTAVVSLDEQGDIDPRPVLVGPLRRVRRVAVAPETEEKFSGAGMEHSVFVRSGAGVAVCGGSRVPVRADMAVTTSLGENLVVRAGAEGLDLICATFVVDDAAGGGPAGTGEAR
ncbi:cupin domain-containing protein [Streptomyces sp. NPDC087300]|uniref:cupin domain-containing protein n=1 Tax=Streptomyces sp. NPDC087300 TaxID=3365780 RepID=UPI003829B44C